MVSLSLTEGSGRNKRRVGGTAVGVRGVVAMVTKVTLVVAANMEADTDDTDRNDFI